MTADESSLRCDRERDDIWSVGIDEPLNVAHKPNQGLVIHGP